MPAESLIRSVELAGSSLAGSRVLPLVSAQAMRPDAPSDKPVDTREWHERLTDEDIQRAAQKLVKWAGRCAWIAKQHGQTGEVKPDFYTVKNGLILNIITLVFNANASYRKDSFCGIAEEKLGADILPSEKMISPGRPSNEPPSGALLQFPNGLILGTVDAARFVMDAAMHPSDRTGAVDSLQTPQN